MAKKKSLSPFARPADYVYIPLSEASAQERKAAPIVSGCLDYFPDALLEVSMLSKVGNDQHNLGEPLHWARGKSQDEVDTIVRHLLARGTLDTDGVRHSAKAAWRALANLQKEIEEARGDGLISRGSSPE
jgi:dATP/dGTP diphosphohydrolase, N-terminal